jgi:thiol-disulfide isomerase/thioredoxin
MAWWATSALAVEVGELAPAFELPRADGSTLALSELRGQVVLVDFWASWCGPCRKSLPHLDTLQSRYAEQGLRVVAINLDEVRAEAERFLSAVPLDIEIVFDAIGDSATVFGLKAMPSSYLIGRDGRVRARRLGFRAADSVDFEQAIEQALAGDHPP